MAVWSSHHHHHQSLNREGRWDTADDFATSFLHFSLFSTALWDLPYSRPVHSLMLSSHLFLCPPCLLPPSTVPCKMVLARPGPVSISKAVSSLCPMRSLPPKTTTKTTITKNTLVSGYRVKRIRVGKEAVERVSVCARECVCVCVCVFVFASAPCVVF